jgi:hypothetical protein
VITGVAFNDLNANGARDSGEPGLAGVTVFLDLNNNGAFDTGEPITVTQADDPSTPGVDETGQYRFDGLLPNTYPPRTRPPGVGPDLPFRDGDHRDNFLRRHRRRTGHQQRRRL